MNARSLTLSQVSRIPPVVSRPKTKAVETKRILASSTRSEPFPDSVDEFTREKSVVYPTHYATDFIPDPA